MMLCFFSMGFADMVGIGSNYVQEELQLNNSLSGIMISVAFVWFLIISVPTGILMNRIGRKPTVLIALGVTALSLFLPILTLIPALEPARFYIYVCAFALLGMGNALMQTSLNPLVANVVRPEGFSSALALGQFVKAICSFIVPLIAQWGATAVLAALTPWGWKIIFPISCAIAVLAMLCLYFTPIAEVLNEEAKQKRVSTEMAACFRMLRSPYVLLCFIAVACTAGLDIGTNSTAPKLFVERLGFTLSEASFATSFYFIFRTIGQKHNSSGTSIGKQSQCRLKSLFQIGCRSFYLGLKFRKYLSVTDKLFNPGIRSEHHNSRLVFRRHFCDGILYKFRPFFRKILYHAI